MYKLDYKDTGGDFRIRIDADERIDLDDKRWLDFFLSIKSMDSNINSGLADFRVKKAPGPGDDWTFEFSSEDGRDFKQIVRIPVSAPVSISFGNFQTTDFWEESEFGPETRLVRSQFVELIKHYGVTDIRIEHF